jgi:hypothetical protein
MQSIRSEKFSSSSLFDVKNLWERRSLISPAHAHVHNKVGKQDELIGRCIIYQSILMLSLSSRRQDCTYAMERSLLLRVIWSHAEWGAENVEKSVDELVLSGEIPKRRCAGYHVTNTGMTSTRKLVFEIYSIHKRNTPTYCSLVYLCIQLLLSMMQSHETQWLLLDSKENRTYTTVFALRRRPLLETTAYHSIWHGN